VGPALTYSLISLDRARSPEPHPGCPLSIRDWAEIVRPVMKRSLSMMSASQHSVRTTLLVAAMGAVLVGGSAFAQRVGTPTPSPAPPSIGVGTGAPPSPPSAASTSVGTVQPPSPLGANPAGTASPSGFNTNPSTSPGTAGVVPSKSVLPSPAFDMLDTSRRGFVTRDDVAKLPGFDSAFQQADENNDGRLSESEFTRAWMNYSRQP
jgi:hypothetical protein